MKKVDGQVGVAYAHAGQKLDGRRVRLPGVGGAMALEHLGDLPPHCVHRVQVGQRILEDHGDLAAVDAAPRLVAQAGQVLALEQDAALDDVAGPPATRPTPALVLPLFPDPLSPSIPTASPVATRQTTM